MDHVELLTSDARNDPNIKYDDDVSMLIMAVKLNRVECIELLLPDPRFDLIERDKYKRSEVEVVRWQESLETH